jgi:hypothetical protein
MRRTTGTTAAVTDGINMAHLVSKRLHDRIELVARRVIDEEIRKERQRISGIIRNAVWSTAGSSMVQVSDLRKIAELILYVPDSPKEE